MKITPRLDYVYVKIDAELSRASEFGILTPEQVERERKSTGEVMAVGPRVEDIKKGHRVIFGRYAGDDVTQVEKGKKVTYKLIHQEDILAFVE